MSRELIAKARATPAFGHAATIIPELADALEKAMDQAVEGSSRAAHWWCEMDQVIKELRKALTTITVQCDEVKSQGSNYALLSRIYRTAFKALESK